MHALNPIEETKTHIQGHILLDFTQLSVKVRMGRSRIYALIGEGNFPIPVKIGASSHWITSEVDAYISKCMAARSTHASTDKETNVN